MPNQSTNTKKKDKDLPDLIQGAKRIIFEKNKAQMPPPEFPLIRMLEMGVLDLNCAAIGGGKQIDPSTIIIMMYQATVYGKNRLTNEELAKKHGCDRSQVDLIAKHYNFEEIRNLFKAGEDNKAIRILTENKEGIDLFQNFSEEQMFDLAQQLRAANKITDKEVRQALKDLNAKEDRAIKGQQRPYKKAKREEPMQKEKGTAVLEPVRHPGEIIHEELVVKQGLRKDHIANELDITRRYLTGIFGKKKPLTEPFADKLYERFNLPITQEELAIQQVRWDYAHKKNSRRPFKNSPEPS
ncbi:MAG: hypothetical protein KC643_15880 [Nitrospira sp.]|nr:hypothetical protein [Nitrospira sp.]